MTQYERMSGTYRQVGDYVLPNLTVGNETQTAGIGVWRHRRYLKEHHRVRYFNLLTAGMLDSYLADIGIQAQKLFEQTVKSLAEKECVTEKLKENSPMEWVRKMNNIRNRAIEIVNAEVIFI